MSEDEIRNAAYAKWEADGRPEGQHDRHWMEAQSEFNADGGKSPQTWSADHGGGVSPQTRSEGSIDAVEEPSNDWPAADDEAKLG